MVQCTRKVKLYYGVISSIIYTTAIADFGYLRIWLTMAGWASTTLLAIFYTTVVYFDRIHTVPGAEYLSMANVVGTTLVSGSLYVLAALNGDGLEMDSMFLAAIAFTMALKWSITLHVEIRKQQSIMME